MFEGPDAGGKGGALKRIVEPLDPRHYRVSSFAAPTPNEKRHHFLWRFYRELPGLGGMALFDRSWYGRVLVERLEGFATPEQWNSPRLRRDPLPFERTLVLEGMILVKFWMHLSDKEQLRRFEARSSGPAEAMEADRRGLAQPGPQTRKYKSGRGGDVRAHRPRARALGHHRGRTEALRTHQGGLGPLNARIEQGMARWGHPVPPPEELAVLPQPWSGQAHRFSVAAAMILSDRSIKGTLQRRPHRDRAPTTRGACSRRRSICGWAGCSGCSATTRAARST